MGNYLSCVITHGSLACSLKEVTENLGVHSTGLMCFSNQEMDLEEIEISIQKLISQNKPQKTVLFVDLMGGSCWLSANKIKYNQENVTIISGVNIPMLVSFYTNINRLPWDELIEKILFDARRGMVVK